jgi:EPS-associated MarR family transcriptional regulator
MLRWSVVPFQRGRVKLPQEFESHSPKAWAVACQTQAKTVKTPINRANAISEDTRFRVLRLIKENPNASQREIAEALGVSLGGVNYCLRALVCKGLLKIENFRKSGNKIGYLYLLTPEGIAEKTHLTEAFLRRKMAEYEILRREIDSIRSSIESANSSDT